MNSKWRNEVPRRYGGNGDPHVYGARKVWRQVTSASLRDFRGDSVQCQAATPLRCGRRGQLQHVIR